MFYSMFYVLMFYLWKICIICIYLPETDTFIGLRMFPTVHHREFPCVQGNTLTIPLTFFHQLLYTNQYFLNTILVVSNTCTRTHTHTPLKAPFSSLNFYLSNEELGYLNNLKYLNE